MLGNTNLWHNILNAIGTVLGALSLFMVGLGCKADAISGKLDCSGVQILPAWALPWMVGIAAAIPPIKLLINLVRDGLGGMAMQQPPVASDVKTIVVTGDKDSVTKVETKSTGSAASPKAAQPAKVM